METLIDQIELEMKELIIRLDESRNLLYNGREIPCDRKLQGAIVKCNTILKSIIENKLSKSNEVVVNEDSETVESS